MGNLEGKTVGIIVTSEFEDIELQYPLLRLSEEGAKIIVIPIPPPNWLHPRPSIPAKPVTGRFGTPVTIDVMEVGKRFVIKQLDEVSPDGLDCVIFPGGFSPDYLRIEPKVLKFVQEMYNRGKFIAAICHGPWVFINAGLVKGKKVTAYVAISEDLKNAGAIYMDVPAVRDGNMITGRVPDDLPDFCKEIINALSEG